MRRRLSEKSTFTLHMLHMLHMSDMLKEKDIRRKSNGFELLPPPTGRSPSLEEGGLWDGKSSVGRMSAGARCANSFHRCGGPPPSRREVFGGGKSKVGRMSAGNCNCEMCLQRWVASLQRSDVFATVGCTADPRMGAHCAPFYPRCYNNPSSGRAKGYRGDRKAPISNRRQGRRP